MKLRQALLRLRTYSTIEDDYQLFQRRMWNNLTADECAGFKDALHLLPTKNSVAEYNNLHLAQTAQPVFQCTGRDRDWPHRLFVQSVRHQQYRDPERVPVEAPELYGEFCRL